MYKPLLVNVSVSLIVSGVQPHMTVQEVLTLKEQLILLAAYNVVFMVTNNMSKWLLNIYILFICTNRYSSMFLFP